MKSLGLYRLTKALVHGDGVARDFVLAVEWYEKAAAQGCMRARHSLGEMYLTEQDYERAVAEFRRAA
jgi:TPR repeat protein